MKLTVITVCRNAEDTIEKTIKSILTQTYKDIEYIVIDGNSTDNTKAILNRYKSNISILISEKDRGIYDAMNKGVGLSTGAVIIFMNSGDTFFNKYVIDKVVDRWFDNIDIIYGDVYLNNKKEVKDQSSINKPYLMYDNICHQSMFIKKSCFKRVGLFNIKYKIAADFDWLMRAMFWNKLNTRHIGIVIANYEGGGKSDNEKVFRNETGDILNKFFSPIDVTFNRFIFKLTDYLKKQL